jgi:Fe-S-cluster-containing dehydrogenase component
MVIDVNKCTGCYACFLACKDENCGEEHPGYTVAQPMTGQHWINLVEVERGTFPKVKLNHIPVTCGQCENPTCMNQAENGAVYQREDGIVMIDPEKAVGQKQIVNTCPHRMIFWNEEKNVPQKCDMCAHLLDQGFQRPRCVEMCPTGALTFGDLNDPDSEVSKLIAEKKPYVVHPEYGLEEKVLYLNVPKKFVSGTVVFKDTDQCAMGAKLILKGDGVSEETIADEFGDFWFDGLDKNLNLTLTVEADGYETITREVKTIIDCNAGELFLEKSDMAADIEDRY